MIRPDERRLVMATREPDTNRQSAAVEQDWIRHAILAAVPEGWDASPHPSVSAADTGWVVASQRYDLGDFRFRLAEDCRTLICVHSTDMHSFSPQVEEATLIHLGGLTGSALTWLLREIMRTRRPNLTHPT